MRAGQRLTKAMLADNPQTLGRNCSMSEHHHVSSVDTVEEQHMCHVHAVGLIAEIDTHVGAARDEIANGPPLHVHDINTHNRRIRLHCETPIARNR